MSAKGRGNLHTPTRLTVREVGTELLEGMTAGVVLPRRRSRDGSPYKVSAIESVRSSLTGHVYGPLGTSRLSDVSRVDVQALVDKMTRDGLSGQTIRNAVNALSLVYRFARTRKDPGLVSPVGDLELPAAGRRERVVSTVEGQTLLAALPLDLRALYGLAVYGGLRRGEIAGLDWRHVDFATNVVTVERAWCSRSLTMVEPKSAAGRRRVPVPSVLREILLDWAAKSGATGLMFPSARDTGRPFDPRAISRRADKAWAAANAKELERAEAEGREPRLLTRVILHEGRHSAASSFIASGLDPVRVAGWLGHSQTSTTLDRYAHAFEAREQTDAGMLDAFHALALAEAADRGPVAGQ